MQWASKAFDESAMHPLLIIAVFKVVFLAVHPFQDGNGRLSRILTTLLLLRAGYEYVPYASLESIVEENKDLYYKALRRTQTTLNSDDPDWEPWLGFFLRCLKKQKANLATKIEQWMNAVMRRAVAASHCARLIRAALTVDIFYIPALRDRRPKK